MSQIGGAAGKDLPAKKKSPFAGCLTIFAVFVVLMIVLVIVSNVNANKAADAKAAASASATPLVTPVDNATVSKVKKACEDQLRAVASSSKKHFSGVPDKPYDIVSVTFTGDVEQVNLPYKEIAWEVPTTWVSKVADGSTLTNRETCQFRKLQDDARFLP
ncbi:hypothetical protein ACQCSV_13575 [Pseudarthrobacter sp. S3]|uniref:hypothetical protein n=1 Tax=Pseudarthrobacter sp. S3 TaxID=3418419 RepID=UPI003CEB9353